ncbi:hypothetical protein, partial [Bradyrhizobium sp. NBAIM08]|uniref:hypothetical protein n=1 Tax=Bradyrhizobium sp. NBAIM08 TaxID=2793815 RepID=UPI001CD6D8AB
LYVGLLTLVTATVMALWFVLSGDRGGTLVLLAILALGPASDIAVAIVNHAVTRSLGPRALPRLDLADGVPSELRTLVAVPMLLTNTAEVEEQVAGLEVHYLGNRDGDLQFALLSDWLDADSERTDADDELLAVAAAGIDRLNERYG